MNNYCNWRQQLANSLKNIYDNKISKVQSLTFENYIESLFIKNKQQINLWDENDIALITYGDSILDKNEIPLNTLSKFAKYKLDNLINIIHILPFFPYSSDDGFSIIDFEKVNPDLGEWEQINEIASGFKLMVDLVINHASSKSVWFQNYLLGSGEGCNYFIEESTDTDLSLVTRPRSTPLLTPVETKKGIRHVWTTFSDDQIDLNFANPEVLLKFLQILHQYIINGARIIRLDAIAFLWKEPGSTCLHLKQTHEVVKLMRNFVEWVAPDTIILTETNVPNAENLSYFGNNDEAHMVYQFSLPPLLLHALNSGNGDFLNQWASSLPDTSKECTFFNFTSSHDGIGVRPLEGLLPDEEKQKLFDDIEKSGGLISMKRNTDGTESPYELNITYFDALKRTRLGEDGLQEKRFICSQAIMLAMKGLPAFYIHSLFASPNYIKGVKESGRARTINREKLNYNKLINELENDTIRSRVFNQISNLIQIRKKCKAFHPSAKQEIFDMGSKVFGFLRIADNTNEVLVINNLQATDLIIELPGNQKEFTNDLISNKTYNSPTIKLQAYQTLWLAK